MSVCIRVCRSCGFHVYLVTSQAALSGRGGSDGGCVRSVVPPVGSSNLVDLLADDDGVVFADLLLSVHAVVERAAVFVAVAVQRTEQTVTPARETCQ